MERENVTTVPRSVGSSTGRVHIVLVPGFAGFDALGQLEYYAGTTDRYRRWVEDGGARGQAVVLHYFDNLPTAAVSTRAARLRSYLAKRIARGEIQDADRVALVGHSTGGLDIRRLLFSRGRPRKLSVDGGDASGRKVPATAIDVEQSEILEKVARAVFVSVPQYGTNIADWVRGHRPLRRVVIEDLLLAVHGASIPPLEEVLSGLLGQLATLARDPDLVLAARDALDETQPSGDDPIRRADAEEAASQLRLWLQHPVTDFGAIDDLASFNKPPKNSPSPAHYSDRVRDHEREVWDKAGIQTMSVATVARRAFKFDTGEPASRFDLVNPLTWPTRDLADDARQMDVSYLLACRACAGGPFDYPRSVSELCRDIANVDTSLFAEAKLEPAGPKRGDALEVWDNDGIVNTASMLWPNGADTRLVAADHIDIVGHYALRKTKPSPDRSRRRYASYDLLRSHTAFTPDMFEQVWKDVFEFCVS
jgi:triacylglycerol lipase